MDPFHSIKEEVALKIATLRANHTEYRALMEKTHTPNRDTTARRLKIVKELEASKSTLRELKRAVDSIEKNRTQFHTISDHELLDRKAFLNSNKLILNSIKNELDIEESAFRAKNEIHKNGSGYNSLRNESEALVQNQKTYIQDHIRKQDQELEELGLHVEKVGEHAGIINNELKEQGKMLDALDEDIVDVHEHMGIVLGSMAKILRTKDKFQIWTIIALVIILIILIFLVIYT